MTNDIEGTARAKFFSHGGIETLRVKVDADGVVTVWDSVAKHYTRCHALSAGAAKRIARQVRQA